MKTFGKGPQYLGNPNCNACPARHMVLFGPASADIVRSVEAEIGHLRFPTGAEVFAESENGAATYTLTQGMIKLVRHDAHGREHILRLLKAGHVLGLEALSGRPYDHTAIAMADSHVCRVPVSTLNRVLAEAPEVHAAIMRAFDDQLAQADSFLLAVSARSAQAKVAALCLFLRTDPRSTTCQLFKREDIAGLLGLTTETVSRTIADFRRKGLLRSMGGNIFAMSVNDLETIAGD